MNSKTSLTHFSVCSVMQSAHIYKRFYICRRKCEWRWQSKTLCKDALLQWFLECCCVVAGMFWSCYVVTRVVLGVATVMLECSGVAMWSLGCSGGCYGVAMVFLFETICFYLVSRVLLYGHMWKLGCSRGRYVETRVFWSCHGVAMWLLGCSVGLLRSVT